jgi:3-deoxy-D-manno-octulosonic-acid transferase
MQNILLLAIYNFCLVWVLCALKMMSRFQNPKFFWNRLEWNLKERHSSDIHRFLAQAQTQNKAYNLVMAASLGEVKGAINFLTKTQTPLFFMVQTTPALEYLKSKNIPAFYFPLDNPLRIRMLAHSKSVQNILVSESEIWPNLFFIAKICHKPISVLALTLKYKFSQKPKWIRRIIHFPLSFSKQFFSHDIYHLKLPQNLSAEWNDKNRSKLGFFSIHFSELEALLPALKKHPNSFLIPRHLTDFNQWDSFLKTQQIDYTLWPEVKDNTLCLVWNYGLISEIAPLCFSGVMGGSFDSDNGIHNYWELLSHHVGVVYGPQIHPYLQELSQLSEMYCAQSFDDFMVYPIRFDQEKAKILFEFWHKKQLKSIDILNILDLDKQL